MAYLQLHTEFDKITSQFATIPDMLRNMDLILDVECKVSDKQDVISIGIRSCLKRQLPATTILNEIKEMAQDNYVAIADNLGNSLTDKILSL